jgi:hypothetical protein
VVDHLWCAGSPVWPTGDPALHCPAHCANDQRERLAANPAVTAGAITPRATTRPSGDRLPSNFDWRQRLQIPCTEALVATRPVGLGARLTHDPKGDGFYRSPARVSRMVRCCRMLACPWNQGTPMTQQLWSSQRHQTATGRVGLSLPARRAVGDLQLEPETGVLDYGCGRGGDVRALQDLGLDAVGWDPVHFPDGRREPAAWSFSPMF